MEIEKIAVVYATKTNHSKKLAEAIGTAIKVSAGNITDNPILQDTEFLVIVGGIYGGKSMPELLNFLNALQAPALKYAALVTSCASGKQRQDEACSILAEKNITVIDEFICKGRILFVSCRHPNKEDINNAVDFVSKIVTDL